MARFTLLLGCILALYFVQTPFNVVFGQTTPDDMDSSNDMPEGDSLQEIYIAPTDDSIDQLYENTLSIDDLVAGLEEGWEATCEYEVGDSDSPPSYVGFTYNQAATDEYNEPDCPTFILRAEAACYGASGQDFTDVVIANLTVSEADAQSYLPEIKVNFKQYLEDKGVQDIPQCVQSS